MKKIIQFLLAVCLCANVFAAQGNKPVQRIIGELQSRDENFNPVDLFSAPKELSIAGIGNYTYLTLDEAALRSVFKAKYPSIRLSLPLGNDTASMLLTQHKIFTDDFLLTTTDGTGERRTRYEPGIYYQGIIEGKENSLVAISIFSNHIGGIISDENGNWNLGPLEKTGRGATRSNEYVFFNDRTFELPIAQSCGTTDEAVNPENTGGVGSQRAAGDCVRFFFDCDYEMYTYKSSSTTAVGDYVTLLFNAQSVLYGNESIPVSLSGINVWTTTDPFNLGSSQTNMYAYSDYRRTDFNGDLAQLLARDAGGLGGIAWINVICANYSSTSHAGPISYCDINASYSAGSFTFPTYTWDVSATTHEFGHNFGSRHTHWCGWTGGPIDNCNTCWTNVPFDGSCTSGPNPPATGGTLMSYCHGCSGVGINFTAGFGTQPGGLIRSRVEAASCLSTCESTCLETVTVSTPISSGSSTFSASSVVSGISTIASGTTVSFIGGDAVLLGVGFEAKSGSNFTASIGACSALAATPASEHQPMPQSNSLVNALPDLINATDKMLFTAYPNPFTDAVTISFSIPTSEMASVEIIGMDGRLITTLFNARATENQRYNLDFKAGGLLDNGIYFYRIVTESGVTQNKKLLLIR